MVTRLDTSIRLQEPGIATLARNHPHFIQKTAQTQVHLDQHHLCAALRPAHPSIHAYHMIWHACTKVGHKSTKAGQRPRSLHVQHILPRVPVQWLLQALLVQCVSNEADAARQHKQAVEVTHCDDVIHLLLSEAAAARQQVQEQRCTAIKHTQRRHTHRRSGDERAQVHPCTRSNLELPESE